MGLLKKAKNQQAYAKIGVFGFSGTGKTHTAMLIAQGIAEEINSKKIGFFDTETGSDWWVDRMPKGQELYVCKTDSFGDLIKTLRESPADGIDILIVDSITHVWRSLVEEYQEKFKKTDLIMADWAKIKAKWSRFTRLFLNSQIHLIVAGRAGHTYEFEKNAKGKLEPRKTGTKMKVEGEFEFESSLSIEMITEQENGQLLNCAYVKKDRSDEINGKYFKMPSFKDFKPHFSHLNLGKKHVGVQDSNKTVFSETEGEQHSETPVEKIAKKSGPGF